MKLLFISNIIGKRVGSFAMASIFAARELGIEYHMAANFNNSSIAQMREDEKQYGIKLHHVDFHRNPLNPKNIKALKQISTIMRTEQFDLVHCNTPIGGIAGRVEGKRCGINRIIYQAHGFHFYKGSPLLSWIVYYPAEKCLAHWTDALIVINKEDLKIADNFLLRNSKSVYYVPGVGIDLSPFRKQTINREEKRTELGFRPNDVVITSVGELNRNKNNRVILDALKRLNNDNVHYLICGKGHLQQRLEEYAEKIGVSDAVHFLGYRTDVKELLCASDIFVLPSYREGLSRSLMEAMASGLPCVVSNIRGNSDLIDDSLGGFLCDPRNSDDFASAIMKLIVNKDVADKACEHNLKKIQQFEFEKVVVKLKDIYTNTLQSFF